MKRISIIKSSGYVQVEPEHYSKSEYDKKNCFIGYWHRINEIVQLNPGKVLEIGIGNGFVSNYLISRELKTITMDVDGKRM